MACQSLRTLVYSVCPGVPSSLCQLLRPPLTRQTPTKGMSHFFCLASSIASNVDMPEQILGMAWRDRKFARKKKNVALNVNNMSGCLWNCRRKLPVLPGWSPPPLLLRWHHYSQFHPAVYFKLLLPCAHVHASVHVCERMCDRETNSLSLYVIQCVKAPIPISMIISYSLWAKTATLIQFISHLLTGAEMLRPAEVTCEVFQGWGWQSLFYGWEEKATRTG